MSDWVHYIFWMVTTSWICITLTSCTFSGLYVDNGVDQTIIERALSAREKQRFEREVLHLFGLPKRPPQIVGEKLDTVAPKFMLDIYKALENSKNRGLFSEFNVTGDDFRVMKESDTIITLLSRKGHISGVRHERGKRLWFDVTEVPMVDTITNAELRLYQGNTKHSEIRFTQYIVTLYQVLLTFNGEKELQIVDSVTTTNNYEGWLLFNVTNTIATWVAMTSSNRGFYISVHKQNKAAQEVRPEEIGLISSVLSLEEERQPFLVVFLKAGPGGQKVKNRVIRDTRSQVSGDLDVSYSSNPFQSEPMWTLRSCQMQTLYVNFKDLNWHEWIIAPDGYAAFYCSGMCDFPLNAHMNATNHAIVQTLVHLMDPIRVPKPCCAPTKLGQMAVLYYLEDGNVMMKRYKNMIVKSCGCH